MQGRIRATRRRPLPAVRRGDPGCPIRSLPSEPPSPSEGPAPVEGVSPFEELPPARASLPLRSLGSSWIGCSGRWFGTSGSWATTPSRRPSSAREGRGRTRNSSACGARGPDPAHPRPRTGRPGWPSCPRRRRARAGGRARPGRPRRARAQARPLLVLQHSPPPRDTGRAHGRPVPPR